MKNTSNTTIRVIKTESQNSLNQESKMFATSALCSQKKKMDSGNMSRLLGIKNRLIYKLLL